jgi:hypothetical protein
MDHRIRLCIPSLESMEARIDAPAMPIRMQKSHAGKYEPRTSKEGARPHPVNNNQAIEKHAGTFLLSSVAT